MYKLKRQRKENCNDALAFLRLHDITPIRLEFVNNKEQREPIELGPVKCQEKKKDSKDSILMYLYTKEKFNTSHDIYHELSMLNTKQLRSHSGGSRGGAKGISARVSFAQIIMNLFKNSKC